MSSIVCIQSRREQLPHTEIRVVFIYKRTECATEYALQEQNSWILRVSSDLTTDALKRAHEHLSSAHGDITKTIYRLKMFFYWSKISDCVSFCGIN